MEQIKKEIGLRIKSALESADINQRALSKKLNVVESTVTAYVQGAALPNALGLASIAQLCNVSIDWLITGREQAKKTEHQQIIYPLADDEQRALHTAEDLLKYKGLDKRFAVVEVHHQAPPETPQSEEEQQLLLDFRFVDQTSKAMILQVARNAALAFHQKGGRSRPDQDGSQVKSCA